MGHVLGLVASRLRRKRRLRRVGVEEVLLQTHVDVSRGFDREAVELQHAGETRVAERTKRFILSLLLTHTFNIHFVLYSNF